MLLCHCVFTILIWDSVSADDAHFHSISFWQRLFWKVGTLIWCSLSQRKKKIGFASSKLKKIDAFACNIWQVQTFGAFICIEISLLTRFILLMCYFLNETIWFLTVWRYVMTTSGQHICHHIHQTITLTNDI